jgi:TolB protein
LGARVRTAVVGVCFVALLLAAPSAQAADPGPNGKIAFVKNGDIYSVNPDATGLMQLTKTYQIAEASPAFSPDGNYIAFTRNSGDSIWVMRADGTELRRIALLSGADSLSWSPDGGKIAFFRSLGSGNGIWVINVDGTGLTNVITDDSLYSVAWSPDGTKFAVARGSDIWTMNTDGTALTRLTFGAASSKPNWSPDGSTIVFASTRDGSAGDLYTVPSSGGAVTRLTALGAAAEHPVWSPDGTKIVFAICVEINFDCVDDLYVMNADGSGVTLLQGGPEDQRSPDWQPAVGPPLPPIPDALDKIAFVSSRDNGGSNYPEEIYTMNPDGHLQRPLTANGLSDISPEWSPDGTKIAFTSGPVNDIFVMNPDGTSRTNLTQTAADEGSPAWSPDGAKIAYSRPDVNGHVGLWVMNADGSGQVQLTPGTPDYSPAWSPDGTRIAFSHAGAIYTISPTGTGMAPLTTPPPGGRDDAADWSPGGGKIAFVRFAQNGSSQIPSIWTMNADGTGQQQIAVSANFPAWSPDGTLIAFQQGNGPASAQINVMNADGTGVRALTHYPEDGTQPDWRPVSGYPRPRGATPLRVSLVPAQKQCTAPNTTHGAPLSFGSCGPPQLTSGQLTTGTPDSNGLPVRMEASLLLRVIPGNSATPQNEADVKIEGHLNDVLDKSLNDYTGSLRASLPLRITDKDNTPSPGGPGAGTTVPFQYGFDIPCTPDPAPDIGSDCSISTTADTLVPGTVTESLRTIWQVGRVRVDDAGPDGNPDTTADNTVFAVQGVFVP